MRKIGETFTHNGVKLEVRKPTRVIGVCLGCHYQRHLSCSAPREWEENHCSRLYREDEQDIIYSKIE